MKKISYLIVTLIALIIFIPVVNAKEIDVSNFDFDEEIGVEVGDEIVYDANKRDDKFDLEYIRYNFSDVKGEYAIKEEGIRSKTHDFSIPSYSQVSEDDMQIPAGKKIKITLRLQDHCGGATFIEIYYNLIDDTKKKVIYNNIFDALNDNPESYYEGETDILLKDIKREGYKFLGWYKTSDYKEASRVTTIDNDAPETLELYAKWEKNESQVKKDNIEENPNTYTTTYVIAGIFIILMLSTVAVYVYGKKNNI